MIDKNRASRLRSSGFLFFASFTVILAGIVIVCHLGFYQLPLFFLGLGAVSYFVFREKSLYLFFFLLPLINSTPDLFFNGYPFNYMGIPLFYLSGLLLGAVFRKEKLRFDFPWANAYLLFLFLLFLSAFFVFLRWSNLTVSSLAFLKDTPVTVSGDRVSFAVIFPFITLFIFSLSPFATVLIRENNLAESRVMGFLLAGFGVSVGIGLIQKYVNPDFLAQKWWGISQHRFNAGFSDFNSFGFFSGVLFLYLVSRFPGRIPEASREKAKTAPYLILVLVALAGIFLSGSRTAFIFVLFAIGFLLWTPKIRFRTKIVSVSILLISLILFGGTLKNRLLDNMAQLGGIVHSSSVQQDLDRISNGRIQMARNVLPILERFPLSGVGLGNFLFYLKYSRFNEWYYEDLPLNHYLLVLAETGVPGLLAFLFFLFVLAKDRWKSGFFVIFSAMLGALFFNQFFWFPEIAILFWTLAAFPGLRPDRAVIPRKTFVWFAVALLVTFMAGNVSRFHSLHPLTWAKEKEAEYDYGFWYSEISSQGEFRWTKEKAGIRVTLDRNGDSNRFRLICGAPLDKIKGAKQQVRFFWKGKYRETVVFTRNGGSVFFVRGKPFDDGLLEFRVTPVFNLKKMVLGEEARDLGIQWQETQEDTDRIRINLANMKAWPPASAVFNRFYPNRGLFLAVDGEAVFTDLRFSPGSYVVEVMASGTEAGEIYPQMVIALTKRGETGEILGRFSVDPTFKPYRTGEIRFDSETMCALKIGFFNNALIRGHDRNLFVGKITLDRK